MPYTISALCSVSLHTNDFIENILKCRVSFLGILGCPPPLFPNLMLLIAKQERLSLSLSCMRRHCAGREYKAKRHTFS